jgi:pimeloyl-ACP methyl ester carboxylesterase
MTALLLRPFGRPWRARATATAEDDPGASADGTRHTVSYGEYQLAYEVYGSGDRVLVWLHGLLLDANLSRSLARTLAAQGNRVVLLDLLGHGRSDKPRHPAEHRMDIHVEQVVCLLDQLGADQAVLGGVSLGADVSLLTAVSAPERVRGLILDMPVLEWAAPAAAAVFLPLMLGLHFARPGVRLISWAASRLPRSGFGALDSFVGAAASDPGELAAVLHGILLGPIAPTAPQRRSVTAPALVIGHRWGLIHPFSDAKNLARELADARLVQASNVAELWLRPSRLTAELSAFLDEVWAGATPGGPLSEAV